MSERIDRLVQRLEEAAGELDEIMFDRLRAAAAERGGRPVEDRRMLQARRAIDKAVGALRDIDARSSTGDDV